MDSIELDGYTWWRVIPFNDFPKAAYGQYVFSPVIWGMSLSLWSIAIWMAFDLLFQVFVTFKRWSGLYFWTTLCTSIGVGLHASLLFVKGYTVLSEAEDIGTTVLIKLGDILTQTGFSLVLFSRLNLVVRTRYPDFLKWILISILVTSFIVHTSVIVCTFGINVQSPTRLKWKSRVTIAERVIILYFMLQELTLTTFYTWTTAGLIRNQSLGLSQSSLRNQSTKVRRNLFLFMLFAQVVTFFADLTLVIFTFLDLFHLKQICHPIFYAVKLKIDFMALNQLQSLVQPNVNMFVYTNNSGDSDQPHQSRADDEIDKQSGPESQMLAHKKDQPLCLRCRSLRDASLGQDSIACGPS